MNRLVWSAPNLPLSAPDSHDVHVWKFELECDRSIISRLNLLLADDEQSRANRFRFERDRNCFTVSRGLLRLILGMYLECPPKQLRFQYGTHGKPELPPSPSVSLCFNISHSNNLVLLAFCCGRPVGIDVEWQRNLSDREGIAKRFFSSGEQKALQAVPVEQHEQAFFNCWTRKEAYIKALGGGLSIPLHQFEVTLAPGEPARLLKTLKGAGSDWSMKSIDCNPDYTAAVVVEGSKLNVRTLSMPIEGLLESDSRKTCF